MKSAVHRGIGVVTAATLAGLAVLPAQAQQAGAMKLGIVTFLSGAAAGPFGVPARNAAELTIEALNAGTLPTPYATKGINGTTIEPVIYYEAGCRSNRGTQE